MDDSRKIRKGEWDRHKGRRTQIEREVGCDGKPAFPGMELRDNVLQPKGKYTGVSGTEPTTVP